ncbi:MAG: hypothetical protein ACRDT4_25750, partial [Micromonosporaceae bacterium]
PGRGAKAGSKPDRDALRDQLLSQGLGVDQVAEEFRARWRFNPLQAYRHACGLSQSAAAGAYNRVTGDAAASVDGSLISKLEQWPAASGKPPTVYNLTVLAQVYQTNPERLVSAADLDQLPPRDQIALRALACPAPDAAATPPAATGVNALDERRSGSPQAAAERSLAAPPGAVAAYDPRAVRQAIERHRHDMDRVLSAGTVTPAWMDLIDETVAGHRHDYVRRPPLPMLGAVVAEFTRIRSLLAERQTTRIQQRLCAAAAQLSILAADALMKLGEINDARAWYRTARLAADEATEAQLQARVRAQAAMLPYYYGDPAEAARLAAEAAAIVADLPCPAGALAAAAEARGAARLGDQQRAHAAMAAARDIFDAIDDDGVEDAFRFPYKRLMLYMSGAAAHLDEPKRAERVHDEALQAYASGPDSFVIDPALIRLDQAATMARASHVDDACQLAVAAITGVPDEHRTGILHRRGSDVLRTVPAEERRRPAAQDLREVLAAAAS